MPPLLALFLCLAFVFFLLWLDRKQSPNITRALWIPTIWMFYIASKPLAVWFPSSGRNIEAGSPLDRAFLSVLLFMSLLILIRRRFDWSKAMRDNPWLIALIVFMLISILWSNIPFTSFKRWIREFQAIITAFVVLSEPSPRQAMESILRRTTYVLIPFSVLLIRYFPEHGIEFGRWTGERMWIGVATQKNGLGRLCIIAAIFLIWSLIRKWRGKHVPVWKYQTYTEIFVLFLTLWLLGGQGGNIFYSATSIYALSLGLLIYWGLYLTKKIGIIFEARVLMVLVAIIIIFGTSAVFLGGSNVGFLASTAGRSETLTGRTDIWAKLLPIALQQPIAGIGFGGFWTPKLRAEIASEGHSGYLEVLLELGFIGLLLVSMFFLSSCRKAQRELAHDFDWGTLWICYIIIALVHNITESSIDSLASHLTAVVLFFTVCSSNIFSPRKKL